jgi:uncharacterized protein YyaL (SSP411 family)
MVFFLSKGGSFVENHKNHLIKEKSPYLLQHVHNPVDWYPWTEEAFEKARREDKPVFLSIGYATCHWCHVMAHESFENPEAAELLNESFVCIKVDREERPDIDEIYMTVCQMMTRQGGWPLTIVMTPDKKPFFAATYIPLENRFGRTGLLELVPQISNVWKNDRERILEAASETTTMLIESEEPSAILQDGVLERVFNESGQSFDAERGGFNPAPKFPAPHRLVFLIRQDPVKARPMVEKTLTAMRRGGIWDHVGFGIHRYSTDREWLVPHFEKMLYDQAMTALACIEAYEAYGDAFYRSMAEEIFTYVLRDMRSPEDGFYSAEDADSEGVEGRFYVWSIEELQSVLDASELELVVKRFNVRADGNFLDETTHQKTGANILHLKNLEKTPNAIRQKLFDAREQRIHPLKDTKVLADWNGLIIAALAKATRVFDVSEYEAAARHAVQFVWEKMQDEGRLMHRWREGQTAVPGQLADYAFMIFGQLELYESTFDFQTLEKALLLNEAVLTHFHDKLNGGFFQTADDAEELIVRPKSMHDGAYPSGNSIQVMNLIKLARLTGRVEYEALADRTLRAFAATLNRAPSAFAQALQAVQFSQAKSVEVSISGDSNAEKTRELIRAVRSVYAPFKTVRLADLSGEEPAVRICRNFSCDTPLTDPDQVAEALKR